MIPMEDAQEAALKAADIEAADADISATTLSEVAGVACYKVEFTSGEFRDADGGSRLHCPCYGTDLRFSLSPGTDLSRCTGTECNRYRNRG